MVPSGVAGQLVSAAGRPRLILLGTKGGPTPSRYRAPATCALVVGTTTVLIDCPDGVARQLVLAGVDPTSVKAIFISHHHSDHVAGLGAFLMLAWGAGLKSKIDVYGPPPLHRILRAELDAAGPDLAYRMREEGRPNLRKLVQSHELIGRQQQEMAPSLRITSVPVNHYTVPARAYRFDVAGRSFVISGDTAPSQALVTLARDCDVLVHEAMYLPALDRLTDGNAPSLRDHLLKSHTTTEQLGELAAAANVGKVVLSHLVPAFADITDVMWAEGVRKAYKGEVIIGRDLMEID